MEYSIQINYKKSKEKISPELKNFYNDGALFGFIIKQIENKIFDLTDKLCDKKNFEQILLFLVIHLLQKL